MMRSKTPPKTIAPKSKEASFGDTIATESDSAGEEEAFVSEAMAMEEESTTPAVLTPLPKQSVRSPSRSTALALRDPLRVYMEDTKRYPLLTREQEHELAVHLLETGDPKAARTLVESNLRLVVKIAYEYQRAHQNLLDIVQEGNVGLMQAVTKYDPYRGVKLSSYAAWWIRAYILKFILNNHRLVKVGTTQAQRKLFFNLRKEHDRLVASGFTPDAAAIAKSLDVREKDVVEMQKRLAAPDASFDAPLRSGEDGTTRTRHDVMESAATDRPDTAVEASQFQNLLKEKLYLFADTLEGREDRIFRQRWLTEDPKTLQELGNEFGVSRERARQLEKRLLDRVRIYLEKELGTAVDIGSSAAP